MIKVLPDQIPSWLNCLAILSSSFCLIFHNSPNFTCEAVSLSSVMCNVAFSNAINKKY